MAEEIAVLGGKVRLLQPAEGFRTCIDSVLLAAACPAKDGESVLDLGCGVGGAGLCVLTRVPDAMLTGIDIQSDHIDLAHQNAALNNKTDNAAFLHADIVKYKDGTFDHVICNPPYLDKGAHLVSPVESKATAHGHQENVALKDWVDTGFQNLKSKGSFTIIHRADQTDEIIKAMGKRFGAVEIIPLWPKAGQPAKRIIIRAIKDRRSPSTMHAGIILHQDDGAYTQDAENILRSGQSLFSGHSA